MMMMMHAACHTYVLTKYEVETINYVNKKIECRAPIAAAKKKKVNVQ